MEVNGRLIRFGYGGKFKRFETFNGVQYTLSDDCVVTAEHYGDCAAEIDCMQVQSLRPIHVDRPKVTVRTRGKGIRSKTRRLEIPNVCAEQTYASRQEAARANGLSPSGMFNALQKQGNRYKIGNLWFEEL